MDNKISVKSPSIWELLKSLPTASTSDSRWGIFSILISISFFLLGLAITSLSFYPTTLGGTWSMIVAFILLGFGLIVFGITLYIGYLFWKKSREDLLKEKQQVRE